MNIAAPYSPRLATTTFGPIAISAGAARARLGSPVSIRISASFSSTQSVSAMAASSDSRSVSIQRFIESSAANSAPSHSARTRRWRSGWMFPSISMSDARDSAESFGSNSANTFSCVSSVCATFMSYS